MIVRTLAAALVAAALAPAAAQAQQANPERLYVNGDLAFYTQAQGRYLKTPAATNSAQYLADDCYTREDGAYSLAHFDGAWQLVDSAACDLFAMSMPLRMGPGFVLDLEGTNNSGAPYSVDCEPDAVHVGDIVAWHVGGNPEGDYVRSSVQGASDSACYNHVSEPISLADFGGSWTLIDAADCDAGQATFSTVVRTNDSCDPTLHSWIITLR